MEKVMWGYRAMPGTGELNWAIWVGEDGKITTLGEPPVEEMEKAKRITNDSRV